VAALRTIFLLQVTARYSARSCPNNEAISRFILPSTHTTYVTFASSNTLLRQLLNLQKLSISSSQVLRREFDIAENKGRVFTNESFLRHCACSSSF
jgi:hypothetical protein